MAIVDEVEAVSCQFRDLMKSMRIIAVVGTLIVGCNTFSFAQARFWIAPHDIAIGSSPPIGNEVSQLTAPLGVPGQALHIWVRPNAGKTLQNFSLNLVATDPNVIAFTSVEVHNDSMRFEVVQDSTVGMDPDADDHAATACYLGDEPAERAVWGIRGFSIDELVGTGLGPAAIENDSHYDSDNDAWLLSTVYYEATELGSTDLFLQIGEMGINNLHETTTQFTALFGNPSDVAQSADSDRCVSGNSPEATVTVVDGLLGDFDFSGVLDPADIDLLSAAVNLGTHPLGFDITTDALVNQWDREVWVEELAGTFFGDADLNGTVEFSDFLVQSGNYNLAGGWADGDFDGDGMIQFGDFLLLSMNFGLAANAASVPEPTYTAWATISMAAFLLRKRKRIRV